MVFFVAPIASAQAPVPVGPDPTAVATPDPCSDRFTQRMHFHYTTTVYRTRRVIRKRARERMTRMRACAKSAKAARNMVRLQRDEARRRRVRKVVEAVAVPLAAIAACESGGSPRAVSAGGHYRGKYQFDYRTWRTVGGRGDPAAAPEDEQDMRAAVLYRQRGAQPWPVCGH